MFCLLKKIYSNPSLCCRYSDNENDQMQNAYSGQGNNNTGNGEGDKANGDGNASQEQQTANHNGQQEDIVTVVSTLDGDYNPFDAFNISQADTYCNLWSYDLMNSCNGGNCQCIYTEQLISKNLLSCSEAWDCPSSCPVCLQCMRQVCGGSTVLVSAVRTGTKALPAFLSLLTIALAVCYIVPRRKKNDGGLEENLIDSDVEMSELGCKTWMIPVSKMDGLPAENGDDSKPVWLAPASEAGPIQTRLIPVSSGKFKREETAMLVVVPRPVNLKEKQKDGSLFPDILKDTENDDVATSDSAKDTGGNGMHQMEDDEFTPGLWLVPLSQESVASSISVSVSDDDNNTIGSSLGDDVDTQSIGSNDLSFEPSIGEEQGGGNEQSSHDENIVLVEGKSKNHVIESIKPEYRLRDDSSFHSSKASTISSREEYDDDQNLGLASIIGPDMAEI
jgi:hypothetical protein